MNADTAPTDHDPASTEVIVRRFTHNDCDVVAIGAGPPDAPRTLYGNVFRHGKLLGSYHCADGVHQSDWRVVTANGWPLVLDLRRWDPLSEEDAVTVLTTVHTARDSFESEQRLRDFLHGRSLSARAVPSPH